MMAGYIVALGFAKKEKPFCRLHEIIGMKGF